MAQAILKEPIKKKSVFRHTWLYGLIALPPIVLIALYYILNNNKQIIDWVLTNISLPYRDLAAQFTSFSLFKHFSVAEVIITLVVLWTLYFVIKTVVTMIRKQHRWLYLLRRLYIIIVVGMYIVALNLWIWDAGYHGTNLAEKISLDNVGITVKQLTAATELFAEKANELSYQVERDASKHFAEDRQSYFEPGKDVYTNLVKQYPVLDGTAYPAKPMFYSKLESAFGFTGVYIALTGETNINIDAPASYIPATIAHEMAHQRGVNSEEEANFTAIAACITSDIDVYEYSGYLFGLTHLMNSLYNADSNAYSHIRSTLNDNVIQDIEDNNAYWANHETAVSETVTNVYDGYLKSNGIESGINSYGACVDMLVLWLNEN